MVSRDLLELAVTDPVEAGITHVGDRDLVVVTQDYPREDDRPYKVVLAVSFLALALGLGFVLIALALAVNVLIHMLSRTEREGRW